MDVDGACRGLRQRPVCREPSRPVRSGEPPLGWAAAVPLVSDTAYPRLEPAPSPAEVVRFTPTLAEIAFVHRRTRQPGPRLALLVLLKTFQRLGYFIPLGQVPTPVVEHVAIHVPGLASPGDALAGYETSTYRSRLIPWRRARRLRNVHLPEPVDRPGPRLRRGLRLRAQGAPHGPGGQRRGGPCPRGRRRYHQRRDRGVGPPALRVASLRDVGEARHCGPRHGEPRLPSADRRCPAGRGSPAPERLAGPAARPGADRLGSGEDRTEAPDPAEHARLSAPPRLAARARCRHRGVHDHPDSQGPLLCRRGADPDRQRYGRDGRAEAAGADGGAAPGPDRPDA